jgi:hypothetical protein
LCGISRRDDAIQNRANACSTLSCADRTFSQPRCALAERVQDIDELGGLLHDQRTIEMEQLYCNPVEWVVLTAQQDAAFNLLENCPPRR